MVDLLLVAQTMQVRFLPEAFGGWIGRVVKAYDLKSYGNSRVGSNPASIVFGFWIFSSVVEQWIADPWVAGSNPARSSAAIAQFAEHSPCKRKVTGSSPVGGL